MILSLRIFSLLALVVVVSLILHGCEDAFDSVEVDGVAENTKLEIAATAAVSQHFSATTIPGTVVTTTTAAQFHQITHTSQLVTAATASTSHRLSTTIVLGTTATPTIAIPSHQIKQTTHPVTLVPAASMPQLSTTIVPVTTTTTTTVTPSYITHETTQLVIAITSAQSPQLSTTSVSGTSATTAIAATSLQIKHTTQLVTSATSALSLRSSTTIVAGTTATTTTAATSNQIKQLLSWNAEPWGECVHQASMSIDQNMSVGIATRQVQCKTLFGGTVVADNLCNPVHKPCACRKCWCDIVHCVNDSSEPSFLNSMCHGLQCMDQQLVQPELEPIGCLTEAEFSGNLPQVQQSPSRFRDTHDYTCMTCQGKKPCRGGLPFFNTLITTHSGCASFCVSMGLDLSGLSPSGSCHCGAAPLNSAVYHLEQPRDCLLMDSSKLQPYNQTDSGNCFVLVHRFVGSYVEHAIPSEWLETLDQDDLYRDSIENGTLITAESQDLAPDGAHESDYQPVLPNANSGPNWDRRCWPYQCGALSPSRMFQYTRTTRPAGVTTDWNKYIMIPYAFQSGLNNDRKNAFRQAADTWRTQTCINLYEVTSGQQITVQSEGDNTGCWASLGVGSWINLGWCNSNLHVGSMMHEIGHSLGMHHEQRRPDATQSYYGMGPYLRMLWQNIDSYWVPQWLPDSAAYVGSAYDGEGDVQVGYAPYDFGSIMHYPVGPPHSTIPAGKTVGNRRTLSDGDVRQISDMYGCHKLLTTPTAAPTAAPTPAPTPSPPSNYYRKENNVGGWGGICTCPDGQRYEVGDNNNWCWSLACENGQAGSCSIFGISRQSKGMKVTCVDSTNPISPSCVDIHEGCSQWVQAGYCRGEYEVSMRHYCPRSCGYCPGGRRLKIRRNETSTPRSRDK